jgi:gliding motility-associated-like protein
MLFLMVGLFLLGSMKVWAQPVVDFSVSSTTVCSGSSIIFTDNTSNITGTPIYSWNFGTGATPASATTVGPHTVTYTGSGLVTVRLDVSDDAGSGFIEKTITVYAIPTITNVTPGSRCGSGTVTLGATASAGTINWYSAPTGGSSLGTGPSFTTPSISVTTTYYVDATSGLCTTASRTPVVATVNTIPAITSVTHGTVCGTGTVTLGATSSAGTINWYSAATGGSSLGTGTTFTTPTISITTTYYVDATLGTCTTASRTPVVATVNTMPAITSVTPGSVCGSGTVILGATSSAGTINWYSLSTGGSSLGTGTSFTTPSLSVTTTYYVDATLGACTSVPRTSVIATVNPLPVPTLTSSDPDNIICLGSSVTFTAGGGSNYNFRIGGVSVQSGTSTTYTTSSLINGQIVDVVVSSSAGCISTSAPIINFVNPLPFIFVNSGPTCAPDLLTYSLSVVVSSGTVTSTAGTVVLTGVNVWTISAVQAGTNITVTVTDPGGCQNSIVITAPNCSCPVVNPPVSGGNKAYCASGTIPALTVTVQAGETADWYDSSSGGTLLLSGNLSYTPTAAGTFYAMTRNITTSCVSSTRTAVTLTMNPLPVPTLTSSDADNIICNGASVTFTAGGGTNYNFRVGGVSVQNGTLATYTTSTLTTGQVVDVIVTNSNGCIATSPGITTTVNPGPTPSIISSDADNAFCAGTSVTFTGSGGTNYNFRVEGTSVQNGTSSTYTTTTLLNTNVVDVIVTDANGCSATSPGISNTVYVIPVPTLASSDPDNTFCSGTSITFIAGGGTGYNFRVDGASVQDGTESNYTTSSLTDGQVLDVIVTIPNGCSATSSAITNTVITTPTADAGTGGDECDLNFTFKAVASIGAGTWTKTSGPGTATFNPSPNSPTATVTVSLYGAYTFTWTEVNNTCSSSASVNVNFYQAPIANPGTGGNNCGTDYYFKAVPSIGIGTWTKTSGPGTATFSPSENYPTALVSVSEYGQYTFQWKEVNGTCSDSASINVTFVEAEAANAGNGGLECDLDFKLNAVPGSTAGTWTKSSGPGNAVFTPNANDPKALVTVDTVGVYDFAWTIVNVACESSDMVTVTFRNLPALSVENDTTICEGETVYLRATGIGAFQWKPASLVSNPILNDPTTSPDTTTTFKVTLTDGFGCVNSDSIKVEVAKKPVANAGPDQILEYEFTTEMQATEPGSGEKGVWSLISGTGLISDTLNAETTIQGLTMNENKFSWKVTNGICPASIDTVNIIVHDLKIPTLITPNMDGKNDYFVLKGLNPLQTQLVIFNRRGVQVYKNDHYDNTWNGIDYNDNPLPDDTYFYVLKIQNNKSYSGYIVIRR